MKRFAVVLLVLAGACVADSDPRWQLDHDRIVAVRVTPPHLPSGAHATVDGLVAHVGATTTVSAPAVVIAVSPPPSLANVVQPDGSIVAPDEAALDQARAALGLPAGAPVPLNIGVSFGGPDPKHPLVAEKLVYLGDAGDNPVMPEITVDGAAPADGASLTIPFDTDVPLRIAADPKWTVFWLTSCGTMHDDNELAAFVHVLPDDPADGELAVVLRDPTGGVVWKTWPVHSAKPAP